jgi:DNA-binding CsgD family transcriptional regulator
MDTPNYKRLSRKEMLAHFEQERQEWLKAGMSEADIFYIHFGNESEDGRGGDYRVWLDERKHTRSDHKYAPGTPVAIDVVDPNSAWIGGDKGGLCEVEFGIDLEIALAQLTSLQRSSFIEVRLNGRTQADVATALGVSRESVKQAINGALKKLKKIF